MRRELNLFPWLLLFFFTSTQAAGQTDEKNFFHQLLEDQKRIWTAPARAETWSNPEAFFALGVSGISFALDDDPARTIREDRSFSGFNDVFASSTPDLILTAYPLAVIAVGELTDNDGLSEYGLLSTRAALGALAVTLALKSTTLRDRPHTGKIYGFWEGGNSFPSGHSTAAWAIASATARHFDEQKWVPWVVYPVAGLISFSRISSGNHFPSDVAAGSFIGFFVGRFVAADHHRVIQRKSSVTNGPGR